jgi:acetyl-CoA carboxylase carboxyltransferase component
VNREAGLNSIGMVAWRLKLFTPTHPNGRDIIVVGNDITFEIGSFGPQEDVLFDHVSKLARKEGIPRIYLASNSGARIGLAEEIKYKFKVNWLVESDPSKGFLNLYLDDNDYQQLKVKKQGPRESQTCKCLIHICLFVCL